MSTFEVSLDSSSRDRVPGHSPSDYKIQLGTEITRVKTIDLGSFVLGDDPRAAFDAARTRFGISEPMRFSVPTSVTVVEVQTDRNVATGATAQTVRSFNMYVPPTLMTISTAASPRMTTDPVPHGLDTVARHWPIDTVGHPAIRAGAYTQDGDPSVFASLSTIVDHTTFTNDLNYLGQFTETGFVTALSLDEFSAANGAYLEIPRLTIPEAAGVLNAVLTSSSSANGFRGSPRLRFAPSSGRVVLSYLSGEPRTAAGTESSFLCSISGVVAGDYFHRLGFPASAVQTLRHPQASRFFDPLEVRTIELPRMTPDAARLEGVLNTRSNVLFTGVDVQTSFSVVGATSGSISVLLPFGCPFPAAAADYIDWQLRSATLSTRCAWDSTLSRFEFYADPPSGGFTIPFATDGFGAAAAPLLGFEPLDYVVRDSTTLSGRPLPVLRTDTLDAAVALNRHAMLPLLTTVTDTRVEFYRCFRPFQGTLSDSGAPANQIFFYVASPAKAAPHYRVGDVVRIGAKDGTISSSVVLDVLDEYSGTWTTEPPYWRLTLADPTGTLDAKKALTDTTISSLQRPDFVIHGNRPFPSGSAPPLGGDVDPVLRAAYLARTLTTDPTHWYGPAGPQLGFLGSCSQSPGESYVIAPARYSLEPPPYVLMELLQPWNTTAARFLHLGAAGRGDTRDFDGDGADEAHTGSMEHMFAKVIITDGYARVSRDVSSVDLATPSVVNTFHFRFRNPDLSLVDWDGRDHAVSLVLTTDRP